SWTQSEVRRRGPPPSPWANLLTRPTTEEILGQRTAAATAVAACSLLVLTGCGLVVGEPDPVPLTIVSSDWSGWAEGQGSSEGSRDVEATEGESIDLADDLEVTFTEVEEDSVRIRTSQHMSPTSEDGGIDLSSTQTDFTVERGETLEIVTPTMDSGTTYEFSFTE